MTGRPSGHRARELVTISRSLWVDTVTALHSGDPADLRAVLHRLLATAPAGWSTELTEISGQWPADRPRLSPKEPDRL